MIKALIIILVLALPLGAQESFLSKPDKVWENWQAHNHWMYKLDDQPWKTWGWHRVLTDGTGVAVTKLTPLTYRQGKLITCSLYFVREVQNWREGSCRCFDSFMDVIAPCTAVRMRF